MKILVIGGTGFLGGACTRDALAKGHDVTVLSRTGQSVDHQATPLIADRLDLPDLKGRFDAIIDTCAYAPAHVSALMAALGDDRPHYTLISSLSVYDDFSKPQVDETCPAAGPSPEDLTLAKAVPRGRMTDATQYGEAYGRLKRGCEIVAQSAFATTVIRLGLIVGPGDYTDRFTAWVRRGDLGGEMAVPAPAERPWQLIDVQDAAAQIVDMTAAGRDGVYNLTGLSMPMSAILDRICAIADAGTTARYVPLEQFEAKGHRPWTDLPLIPPDLFGFAHFMEVNIDKVLAEGLCFRELDQTIRETLDWDRGRRQIALCCGLSPSQEADLL